MITTIIIIGLLIVISQKKEGITIYLKTSRVLARIDIKNIHLIPSIQFLQVLQYSDYIIVCWRYKEKEQHESKPRLVRSREYMRWLIFEFHFNRISKTYIGQLYPKGYDFLKDTDDGILTKQKAYEATL